MASDAQSVDPRSNLLGFRNAVVSEPVIEVGGYELPSMLFGQRMGQVEQCNRIGATGHGKHDAAIRW
jgi:hypothetical protein